MSVAGIVLAAGQSRRYGANKLLQPLAGEALICQVLRNCLHSRLASIQVVVADRSGVETLIRDRFGTDARMQVVSIDHAELGQNASLKAGLRALKEESTAALILLGDMPFLPSSVIDRMLDCFAVDRRLTIPICGGLERHPRLILRSQFRHFLELADDAKPQRALDSVPAGAIRRLEFAEAAWFRDVDLPTDLIGPG